MAKKALALVLATMMFCAAALAAGDAFVGVYHDVNDGVTRLRVIQDGDGFDVSLDIYRLVGLEFTAVFDDGKLRGTAEIDGDASAVVEIASGYPGPKVTIVESSWGLLESGTTFSFALGAPAIDAETFTWLFTKRMTGFSGTAGASLKAAKAACELLDTLVLSDAAYCDPSELTAAIIEAVSGLTLTVRSELYQNLTGSITSLLDGAFQGDEYALGTFEDAGCADQIAELLKDPLAQADWEAFRTAYGMVGHV